MFTKMKYICGKIAKRAVPTEAGMGMKKMACARLYAEQCVCLFSRKNFNPNLKI